MVTLALLRLPLFPVTLVLFVTPQSINVNQRSINFVVVLQTKIVTHSVTVLITSVQLKNLTTRLAQQVTNVYLQIVQAVPALPLLLPAILHVLAGITALLVALQKNAILTLL
jgi:hypothetical protein